MIIETVLRRFQVEKPDNFSFHRKIIELKNQVDTNENNNRLIIELLNEINPLRTELAHEFYFKAETGELEKWSIKVLTNLKGTKYSKYTYRTKIVHAFSILSINILELKD